MRRVLARTDENAARWSKRFEVPLLVVALMVIPSLALDQPGVDQPWHALGAAMNWIIWIAFTVELFVMLRVSPDWRGYLRRNPTDLIVVLLTPPFLTSIFNSVRLLRLTRLARLFRLEPIVKWMFRSGGLKYATLFAALVVLAAAEVFSNLENTSYFEGFYWAITTVTTVGYGDELPTTDESKALAIMVMIVGIGFFAALAGALADRFIEGRAEELAAAEHEALSADAELIAKVDALSAQVQDLRAALGTRSAESSR